MLTDFILVKKSYGYSTDRIYHIVRCHVSKTNFVDGASLPWIENTLMSVWNTLMSICFVKPRTFRSRVTFIFYLIVSVMLTDFILVKKSSGYSTDRIYHIVRCHVSKTSFVNGLSLPCVLSCLCKTFMFLCEVHVLDMNSILKFNSFHRPKFKLFDFYSCN